MRLNIPNSFFVTATDTGAGKTTATEFMMTTMQNKGYKAIGCKPIACGLDEKGINEDVARYHKINSLALPSHIINPLCFDLPASPNIAAKVVQKPIHTDELVMTLKSLQDAPVDFIFYEGIGGWKVPLNKHETMADLVRKLQVPILLVVGLRVGCLNHALLTWNAISQETIPVIGWVGNVIDPLTPALNEHINTLQEWIEAPYLGTLSHLNDSHEPLQPINIDKLITHVPYK